MMDIKNLNVQPIAGFEVRGLFIVAVFPSPFRGLVSTLCGEEKHHDRVRVIHDCVLCKAYGHENCPYVREGIKFFQNHTGNNFPSYSILQRQVNFDPQWTQIPLPNEQLRVNPIEGQYSSKHSRGCRKAPPNM